MNNETVKPLIFDYLDVSSYLLDFYKYRKSGSKIFSYESWAQELGIKSRSLLRMVVMGERPLTPTLTKAISYGLPLNEQELKYFFLLVEYNRAKTKEQKNFFWKQMIPLIKSQEARTELHADDFLSSHWLPKIQSLLSFTDLNKTAPNIATLLNMKTEEVQSCLNALVALSVVKEHKVSDAESSWSSQIESFKVPEAIQHSALKQYYLRSFDDAKNAIALPSEVRKFRSLLLPLSPEEYSEVLMKLEEAFQEILIEYKSDKFEGRNLYQMNMNLIPLTRTSTAKRYHG